MHAAIVLNGDMDKAFLSEFKKRGQVDYFIAVDGGIRYFSKEILPDLFVGDMDSAASYIGKEKEQLEEYFEETLNLSKENILRFPCEKDETDSELALKKAIYMGAEEITVMAFRGKRMDHVYGNLSLLSYGLKHKVSIILEDEYNRVRMAKEPVKISKDGYSYLSLFSFSEEVRGLTLRGVKYELTDFTLKKGMVLGISNEIKGETAELCLKEGELLVIQSKEDENFQSRR